MSYNNNNIGGGDNLDDGNNGSMGGQGSLVSAMMKEFNNFREKDKSKMEDDEELVNPYFGIEKTHVLQEASAAFNDPKTVKLEPDKCCLLITKLLYLLTQGETFAGEDAIDVFFAVTKLFQSKNTSLRRMTFLFLKEVAESTDPENVIIVIQSLTKDMNSNEYLYRANAIRVLCKIIDASILGQLDRYIKQAIVDKNPLVSASALICANQMSVDLDKREIVRRWANEVQECVNARAEMVQYHALSLLYTLKSHDRLAVGRIVQQYTKSTPHSPLAMCILVRYAAKLLQDDVSNSNGAYEFLENCLHHRNEMVIYEAARAICRLPDAAPQDIMPAITVLQLFLNSQKTAIRFAAVRTLSEVAMKFPNVVARCNEDMELLINDSNKSIATLAITTLLKTGSESGIEKLMKQISGFITDIGDEFKIVVVRAVRGLCVKYPKKYSVFLNFLSTILREEGGFEFKKAIVDSMLQLIETIPSAKEAALFHLCEFIEDCEFSSLSAQILHVLGEKGPSTSQPAKYIRFIYNRIILENAHIRAAAISALGKFGAQVDSLMPGITILLQRSQNDDDDEVRDRATLCLRMLNDIANGKTASKSVLVDSLPVSNTSLQRSLELYKMHPNPGPITFDVLPVVEDRDTGIRRGSDAQDDATGLGGIDELAPEQAEATKSKEELYAEAIYAIPQFSNLGNLFKSSSTIALTEEETEYLVNCVKHVFPEHVVLQFNVTNTLNDMLLSEVTVQVEDPDDEEWEILDTIPIPVLKYNVPAPVYVLLKRPNGVFNANFTAELHFKAKECDPSTGEAFDEDDEGVDEDYPVEDVEISPTDFVARINVTNFKAAWEMVGNANELVSKFELPQYKTLKDAIVAVTDFLGLRACEGTESIPHNADTHSVLMSGVYLGGVKVLARTAFSIAPSRSSVNLKVAIRSEDSSVTQIVMDCIQ